MRKLEILTREFLYSSVLFFILLLPNFFVLFHFKEISESFTMLFAYLALSVFIWVFPLIFLPKKIYFCLAFLLFLLSPLEIVFVRNLGIPMTEGFVESVFRTNVSEALEQITANLSTLFLFIVIITCLTFTELPLD